MDDQMYRVIAGLVLGLSITHASAADMTERFGGGSDNWSGAYVGGVLGYGWVNDFNGFVKDDGNDKFYGAIAGFNYQVDDHFVAGLEAEISRANIRFKLAPWVRITNGGAVRARVGYAIDNVLLFADAGIAFADTNINLQDVGYTYGAGIDYKVTDNFIFGVDYQHSTYNNFDNANIDARFDVVRARLMYRFQ